MDLGCECDPVSIHLVVQDLDQRRQTVGSTTGVGNDLILLLVLIQIHTTNKHGSIRTGSTDDDLLCSSLQMSGSLIDGGEDTGRFDNVFGTGFTPFDGGRVSFTIDGDGFTVDDEFTIFLFACTFESTVGGVVGELWGLDAGNEREYGWERVGRGTEEIRETE